MASISYQDLPTVKSRNKNQLNKHFQYIFKEDDDDKEAIKQHFQGVLGRQKPENVKDSLKQLFFNYKEILKKPSDIMVENIDCIEKYKETDVILRSGWQSDPNTRNSPYVGPVNPICGSTISKSCKDFRVL